MQLREERSEDETTCSHLWDLATSLVEILGFHEFPQFILETQSELQSPHVIVREEFSLLPPADTFKCHLDADYDPRFFS